MSHFISHFVTKKETKKETLQCQTEYSPGPHTWSDWNTIWHGWWSSCSSYKFQVSSTSDERLPSCEGSKFGWSHYLANGYTTAVLRYGHDRANVLLNIAVVLCIIDCSWCRCVVSCWWCELTVEEFVRDHQHSVCKLTYSLSLYIIL